MLKKQSYHIDFDMIPQCMQRDGLGDLNTSFDSKVSAIFDLVVKLEKLFGLKFEKDGFYNVKTFDDLGDVFENIVSSRKLNLNISLALGQDTC